MQRPAQSHADRAAQRRRLRAADAARCVRRAAAISSPSAAAYDRSSVGFAQSTELGYLNPDRSVTGVDAFGDGVTGGDVDGEPFDTRVDLDGMIHTWSVFATDTLSLGDAWHLTLSGRYNRTTHQQSRPHQSRRRAGLARRRPCVQPLQSGRRRDLQSRRARVNLYAGYSEGSRAPTSIELGCADPDEPCKLPNAMAGDPPLDQVVTQDRGSRRARRSSAASAGTPGVFRAGNHDDILFVTSEQTGFGYFKNFGKTRRQGLELGANAPRRPRHARRRLHLPRRDVPERRDRQRREQQHQRRRGGGRTRARGHDRDRAGRSHSAHPAAHVQGVRRRAVGSRASLDVDLVAVSSSFARGNENNQHEPDGTYYLGAGSTRLRGRESRRQLPPQTVAHNRGADQQPVRPPLLHGGAARTDRVHRHGRVHRPTLPADRRRVSGPAGDVLRAGGAGAGVGRHAIQVLVEEIRRSKRSGVAQPFRAASAPPRRAPARPRRQRERDQDRGQRVERRGVRAGRVDAPGEQQRPDRRGEHGHRLRRALNAPQMRAAVGACPRS